MAKQYSWSLIWHPLHMNVLLRTTQRSKNLLRETCFEAYYSQYDAEISLKGVEFKRIDVKSLRYQIKESCGNWCAYKIQTWSQKQNFMTFTSFVKQIYHKLITFLTNFLFFHRILGIFATGVTCQQRMVISSWLRTPTHIGSACVIEIQAQFIGQDW